MHASASTSRKQCVLLRALLRHQSAGSTRIIHREDPETPPCFRPWLENPESGRSQTVHEDPGEVLFREWSAYKDQDLLFSKGDTWDSMLSQGIMLLIRFCQDDRIRIVRPKHNLQIKLTRPIAGNEFVSYIDAIGKLDGRPCLLEWKTSSSRYPETPEGLLRLDPQLVCYSWMTGISEVAQIVFVRKSVDIQYLRTTIFAGAAGGVRSTSGGDHPENRDVRIPAAQRHPLSPESTYHMPICRSLS